MIRWINIEELSDFCRRHGKKYWETNFCNFSYDSNSIKKFILFDADDEDVEFTEPFPCLRWYGFAPFPFKLTSVLNDGVNEFSIVSLLLPEPVKDDVETGWEVLRNLDLPFDFIKHINFIAGTKYSSNALYSVDENNLSFEFYRGRSERDVESLQKFLIECDFSRPLFIDKSESYPADWLAFEGEKNIARYGNKYAVERLALERSKHNNSVIKVYSPDIHNSTIIFENGIKRNEN